MFCSPTAPPPPNVMFEKVREGDHATLAETLRADPHAIEWRDSLGYTLLHWAAAVDDDGAVRILLDAGADPNARDQRGRTPLHLAAMSQLKRGDVMIKTLIARGACVDAADCGGVTPLQFARGIDRTDLAQALLAAGATEPAIASHLPEASDLRVADAAPSAAPLRSTASASASASERSPDIRPRRPRPFAVRRAWARLNGFRQPPPALHRDG
jgi:ankyrin repeat protein